MAKRAKKRGLHAHGCVRCGWRYTDTCATPEHNSVCHRCRTGHVRPVWENAYAPALCCAKHARLVHSRRQPGEKTTERQRLNLGGPPDMQWWICSSCERTFPFRHPGRDGAYRIWDDDLVAQMEQRVAEEAARQEEAEDERFGRSA